MILLKMNSLGEKKSGTICVVLGCMYSGKTTEVIKECRKWMSISRKAVCINYNGDNRYGDDEKVYSHDLNTMECIRAVKLSDVDTQLILAGDIILINEGQFFDDLIEYCVKWCEEYGKDVIVSGLDGDFERKPFGKILELIPYANSVTKLNAFCSLCSDGTHAHFSLRLSNEREQVVIGSDNYVAVCRDHYVKLQNKQS